MKFGKQRHQITRLKDCKLTGKSLFGEKQPGEKTLGEKRNKQKETVKHCDDERCFVRGYN